MQPIEFIGSFEEILAKSEPSDPRLTSVLLARLPVTRGLEPRYAFIFSGVEAEPLTKLVGGVVQQIADKVATKG